MTDPSSSEQELKPEVLLEGCNRSMFLKALIFSAVGHVVFAGVTSFSLYADWAEHGMFREGYGLLSPSDIKLIVKEEAKDAEKKAQEEMLAKDLEEQRKQAQLEMENEEESSPTPEPQNPEAASSTPTPPEIEPLPPKREFSLDDLPDL